MNIWIAKIKHRSCQEVWQFLHIVFYCLFLFLITGRKNTELSVLFFPLKITSWIYENFASYLNLWTQGILWLFFLLILFFIIFHCGKNIHNIKCTILAITVLLSIFILCNQSQEFFHLAKLQLYTCWFLNITVILQRITLYHWNENKWYTESMSMMCQLV